MSLNEDIFIVATIADIHFNAIKPENMYEQLEEGFLKFLNNHHCNMVVIAGDLLDSIISWNSKSSYLLTRFIDKLVSISLERGIKYIRLVEGTLSHDNGQNKNFKIYEDRNDINFKIINNVTEEVIEGMNILYIPEEYIKDFEGYYGKYLNNHKKYDFIFGHGLLKEVSFVALKQESGVTLSKAPVFDTKRLINCCKGPGYFGHIHTRMNIKKHMNYVGSYTRWVYGEEEPKGFMVTIYNKKTNQYLQEFVENKMAPRYDTVDLINVDKYVNSPEALIKEINTLRKDFLRMKIILTDNQKDYSLFINFIKEYYNKNKFFKVEIIDKSKKLAEEVREEKVNLILDKYGFIFDKDKVHTIEEKIVKFIKIKFGCERDLEKISELIGSKTNK